MLAGESSYPRLSCAHWNRCTMHLVVTPPLMRCPSELYSFSTPPPVLLLMPNHALCSAPASAALVNMSCTPRIVVLTKPSSSWSRCSWHCSLIWQTHIHSGVLYNLNFCKTLVSLACVFLCGSKILQKIKCLCNRFFCPNRKIMWGRALHKLIPKWNPPTFKIESSSVVFL